MDLNPEELGAVAIRRRRPRGQIGGVLWMIEQGRDCKDIISQLAAVNHALDKAGFALIATNLKKCLAEHGGADSADVQSLKELFLSLA